ncbi:MULTISPECIES: UDP-2,4-diacetamido-2,4,6-trideoxy-beta-L-altropyranose hydrolase [unclassified Halomonas]|uniref:UDP-2,4-diacetamido-2,4, 6-trideoxy-beta-L-altropyranose hydrolase n=1 Tax=unclassified Halomonas TaxID=2609666 RepID=UPI0007D9F8D9|nr:MULTISPECIES: UDP-2,4-diacetamido-2,4,6-trideoxy-beta-L-altropyranose hydrolase [unclassified Halomonas]MBT2786010.1 UDP-2,4-diacetamido-2,4,6-trideoxy-beta-L-altropyranose hydrolase [Halomonas sp. ISL-106]MBT2797032.1 UDP-2,4-diacetamido-2,4,6-trideoxy-beta-L-altropyranose hydrolase [Halomonas sp. ISL-104]OAL58419.1 UDP-2,4-diacetamido-2,4,6-trideoxy-beta-L-altropyranose hydrolase [Halomonas sp. ALS9]
MKVAFRADASVQIGTGHVMRCLTLAEELRRQGHQCLFICRNHEGHLAGLITEKGFDLHLLQSPAQLETLAKDEPTLAHSGWLGVPWETDAKQTLEVLARNNIDWLIVDHYALDSQWECQLAEAVGQIMVIDDLADREHECAVLLDQNLGRESADYEALIPSTCTKLIGPQFALLRPEFAELRPTSLERRRAPEFKRILISLGGVDRTNVTGEVLEVLSNSTLPTETELDIVMGRSAPHLEYVKKQALELPFQSTVSVSVNDIAARMCAADFSIGGAGSTSWERCCLGLPSIVVVLANNQRLIAAALEKAGCAEKSSISGVDGRVRSVIQKLNAQHSILMHMSDNAEKVCDGKGCLRVVSTLCPGDNV